MPPQTSTPINANFPSEKLTIGAGVAIFHLATERVVVCYHSRDQYWFLPKGRANANESTTQAAEREGFEESGYRNRLLPLPFKHRQPDPDEGNEAFVAQPIWTQLLPLSATSQYLLFWYAAETVSAEVELLYANDEDVATTGSKRVYKPPPELSRDATLEQRIATDVLADAAGKSKFYEPVWHAGTGVDEEELLYRSQLLSITEARTKLKGSVMEDVVRRGWEGIQLRMKMERDRGLRSADNHA